MYHDKAFGCYNTCADFAVVSTSRSVSSGSGGRKRYGSWVRVKMGSVFRSKVRYAVSGLCMLQVCCNLLGDNAVEQKKIEFGRKVVAIGYEFDLDKDLVTLSQEIYTAHYMRLCPSISKRV